MFEGLPWARLVVDPWQDWAGFRRTVANMDLCLQLSMTETFNVTSADAVAEGVPCVVTPVVEWAPDHWKVGTDAVEDAARVGGYLLREHDAAREGAAALDTYVARSVAVWRAFLESESSATLPAPKGAA
jgi:hypothetical protein